MNIKNFRHLFFDRSFRLLSLAKSFSTYQRQARKHCRVIKNIPYHPDGHPAHLLDIYQPKDFALPRPVILYIHGGGFTMCSKDTHQGIGLAYAKNGHLVFAINYRLSPKHRYPAALEDAAHALLWVKIHAAEYGGDADQIFVAGESAGGNLTLALAAAACFPVDEPGVDMIREACVAPKGIMVLCGMLQVSEPRHLTSAGAPAMPASLKLGLSIAKDVSRAYLGPGYKVPDPHRILADPLLILESEIPTVRPFPVTYAMCGTHDILISHTRRLENALNRRGLRNTIRYFPRQGHAFHLLGLSTQAEIFWRDNLAFLRNESRFPVPRGNDHGMD